MQRVILEEIITVLGTIVSVMIIRYMMDLSSPEKDLYMIEWYIEELKVQWHHGSFTEMVHWYRARKLLDYDN